eukprot:TRINITY_DN2955_c0_g1_i3.p1 TRINITY_DN2955_c0_g1~~TRINITY_DN2955_c0_g1_i3.p1  ORF type:complete len:431 (-),score=124.02 TRINITY_DN2955_c0_g1_i3:35-1327(-)
MESSRKRDYAVKIITEGKEKFNSQTTFEAKEQGYQLYKRGVEMLVEHLKVEENEYVKKVLVEKLKEFMNEIEKMKSWVDSNRPGGPPAGGGGDHDNSNRAKKIPEGGDKKKDEENDRLKQGLEGAIVQEKPNVKWSDIAGLENAKKALQEAVILPIKFPHIFTGTRTPWKGILLYGPPGTGKTYLAKACATEAEGTFFSISSSDLMSKWVGESEKLIKTLFNMAREKKPAIIFIDEIDSLCGNRSDGENEASRRVKTEFLVQMQGVGKDDQGILVLGATNIPWGLDPAIRRRFEKRIYIPLPEMPARLYLLKSLMKKTPHSISDEEFEEIAQSTEGFSGADISILVRDASFQPLRKCESASHFRSVNVGNKTMWEPCAPSDPQGRPMRMMEINGDQLKLNDISAEDFYSCLLYTSPSPRDRQKSRMPSSA